MAGKSRQQPSSSSSNYHFDSSKPQKGYIVKPEIPGRISVSVDGSPPLVATNISMIDDKELLKPENQGLEVALLFENADPTKPMIISAAGILMHKLIQETVSEEMKKLPLNVLLNGQRIELDAKNDLVLRSGQGKITIASSGVIRMEGIDIEIMSHGENRIKGASIALN